MQWWKYLLTTIIVVLLCGFMCIIFEDRVVYDENMLKDSIVSNASKTNTSGFLPQYIVELNRSVGNESEEFSSKLKDARSINDEVIGWISISEYNIDYPVLLSHDNKEYLRQNLNKEYDISGSIYLDANYREDLSPIKLIHGHNMLNGKMFSNLPQLLKLDSLDNAPLIQYYDDYGLKEYKIFSVFSVNKNVESVIVNQYSSLDEILQIKEEYCKRSWVPVSEIPSGIEMLMLNTCWYGKTGNKHYLHCIVVAVRV